MEPVRLQVGRSRYVLPLTVAAVIFFMSVIKPPSGSGFHAWGPLGFFHLDKWLHTLAYAGQAGVLAMVLNKYRHGKLVAFLLALGYGITIEFIQYPLPARSFDLADIAANSVGAAIGILAWVLVGRRLLRVQ